MPEADWPAGRRFRVFAALTVGLALLGTAGCSSLREGVAFYWQSARGQLDLVRRSEPIDRLLASSDTEPALRRRLERARQIRQFAIERLGLPDNGSFQQYVTLDRPYVLWNVMAAPELSLQLQSWCFPIAGCISYRGYFRREAGERYRDKLRAQGLDVHLAGVPAYSTLGWFDDRVLSTFLFQGDVELARLVFHELAHQVVYVPGDSTFNESYASAVEQIGLDAWLREHGSPRDRRAVEDSRRRRSQWLALLERYRTKLHAIYESAMTDAEKREAKGHSIDAMKRDYEQLRDVEWDGYRGYDRWFQGPVGNAHFGAIATYEKWVPAFRALWVQAQYDAPAFHRMAARIAGLPSEQRRAELERLESSMPQTPVRVAPEMGRTGHDGTRTEGRQESVRQ